MHFEVHWPDGVVQRYYSPSLIVREYVAAGSTYAVEDFVSRMRDAMRIASERVAAKYGYACLRAAQTLDGIERKSREFAGVPGAAVRVAAMTRES